MTTPSTNRPTQPVPCDRHVTGAGAVVKGNRETRATIPMLIVFNAGDLFFFLHNLTPPSNNCTFIPMYS